MAQKTYIAIDLKSFYASVECRALDLDPLKTNLVVADASRTNKTICLAVSPSLKAYGIPGRARLFEVEQAVKEINAERRSAAPGHQFHGESRDADELAADPSLELDYVVATPRMSLYMETSAQIVDIYLRYVSMEDMHVYSIDEVFIDATAYLETRHMTAHEFARMMIQDVLDTTGITATAGIGTNMYLAYPSVNFSSTHSIASGAAQRAIYLVGTLQGSNFTINSTVFTTVVPSSEDGLYYIPLGIMTSATVGYFYPRPDVYAYKNGAFSQVPSVNYLPKTAGSDNALTGDLHITKTNPGVVLASSAGYGNLAFNTTNNYLYLSANTSPQATNGGLILKPFGGSNAATMLQLYTTNSLGQTTYYNFKLEQA